MATPRLNVEEASDALVYAHFHTDDEAAEKFGVSQRTISRYRSRMADNPELSEAVHCKLEELRSEPAWDYLTDAIREACRAAITCARALAERKADDPEAMQAISEHIGRLGNYEQMKRVIDEEIEAARASRNAQINSQAASHGPQGFATYNGVGKA